MCRIQDFYVLSRVIKKAGTQAHPVFVGFQNAIVPAALAAFPEFRVVSKRRMSQA